MSEKKVYFSSVFRSNLRKFDNMLDNFIKALNDGSVYLFEDISTDDDFIEFFTDHQELRTAIYSYIYKNTNSIFNKDIPEYVFSPGEMLDKKAAMNILAYDLVASFKKTEDKIDYNDLALKDFAYRMHRVAVEFALMTTRDEDRLSQVHYYHKKLINELDETNRYIKKFEYAYERFDEDLSLMHKKYKELNVKINEVDNLKNEIDKIMKQITEELRAQKVDALTMTTLVFSAFTFLAVNAGIISGISQITVIAIPEMIKMFLVGNVTVLFGIAFILYLLKKIFEGE